MSRDIAMQHLRSVVTALLLLPAVVAAEPPFDIGGLHVELSYEKAFARTEALGADCRTLDNPGITGAVARCEFPPCEEVSCQAGAEKGTRFSVGGQPVLRIGLEADDARSPVFRIFVIYAGDSDIVEETLREQYGPPTHDMTKNMERSWTHARRMSWNLDHYNLGLQKTSQALVLTRNPEEKTGK